MKILHINGTSKGGAANFAINLHQCLVKKGIKSSICLPKYSSVENSLFVRSSYLKFYDKFKIYFTKFLNKFFLNVRETITLGFFRSFKLKKIIKENNPDIINIHWVGNEFFSLYEILEIEVPIFITIHDMWFFKPIEHYEDLSKKKTSKYKDIIKRIIFNFFLNLKKKIGDKNTHYIFTSEWMLHEGIKSKIIDKKKVHKINCGIDFENWFPINKQLAKKKLNIKTEKKTILFSAMGINNKRKGFNVFLEIINKIKDEFQLIISSDVEPKNLQGLDYLFFKSYDSPELRRELYSAVDVCVVPSKIEAFGLVALEASACNLPVVIFSDNGLSEIILHKKNGYIADKSSPNNLAEGINWVFNTLDRQPDFFNENRQLVKKFDINNIASQYIETYKQILKNK